MSINRREWLLGAAAGSLSPMAGESLPRGVASVWAVSDGEKIGRDDLGHPGKAHNSSWTGQWVRLFGARNEVVAFQLIVESDQAGIDALRVRLPLLRDKRSGREIRYQPPATDPADSVGRPIQIFTENYLYIPRPGDASWIYQAGSPSAPADIVGWKPVQLVPENALPGRGGFPLRVPARRNQAIWIEIYAARNLPTGFYTGELLVEVDGASLRIPVGLDLFDFTLTDQNSLQAMFFYESSQPVLYQGRNLDSEYHRFAHRHRVELVHAYSEADAERARGRFDGADFQLERGYSGPGQGTGNRILPNTFYTPVMAFDDRASAWSNSDEWMRFLARFRPDAITFVYMPDEPGPSEYARIRRIAENIKSNPGPGRGLPVFVSKAYTPELDGAIDIWCSPPQGYDIARAAYERTQGRGYWIYNGGRPQAAAIVIESPATDPRSIPWACFKHSIDVYFYWHTDHWKHNHQKPGEKIQNVWANPITFDTRDGAGDGSFAYGDGVLLYPGTELLHPEENRGIAGPVGTIQLANFRRGLQDHLYLTMARSLGLAPLVEKALTAVVPRVFSDAGETVGFAEDANSYEVARYNLGRAIESLVSREGSRGSGVGRPRRGSSR